MATKILSRIKRTTSIVDSLSRVSLSSGSISGVKHSLSSSGPASWGAGWSVGPSASVHYAFRQEVPSSFMSSEMLREVPAGGVMLRGLGCTPGLGSIAAQPRCQSSMSMSRLWQPSRSFSSLSDVHANVRLGFNKQRRNRGEIKGSSDNQISFGKFGLEALEPAWITYKQITAAQLAIKRNMKGGKLFLRIFPHKPVSLKPAETRMGRGKGNVAFWVAGIKKGRILFEIDGVPESVARRAIAVAASKMPIKMRFVKSMG